MNKKLLATLYLAFIALGISSSMFGPLVMFVKKDIPMNLSESGLFLSGQFFGIFLFMPLAGIVSGLLSRRLFLLLGASLFSLGLMGCFLSSTLWLLVIFSVITGIGNGILAVGINAVVADFDGQGKIGRAMNYLHFFYGIGALLGPGIVTFVIAYGLGWRTMFCVVVVISVVLWGLISTQSMETSQVPESEKSSQKVYQSSILWIFAISMMVYVGVEVSLYSWISTYWGNMKDMLRIPASMAPLLFFATFTVGRLLCGMVSDRIGLLRFIMMATSTSLITAFIWIFQTSSMGTLICLILFGVFLSGIFPTIIGFLTQRFRGNSAKVISFVTLFSSFGGFSVSFVMGKLFDLFGIMAFPQIILILNVVLMLLMGMGVLFVKRSTKACA